MIQTFLRIVKLVVTHAKPVQREYAADLLWQMASTVTCCYRLSDRLESGAASIKVVYRMFQFNRQKPCHRGNWEVVPQRIQKTINIVLFGLPSALAN
jgi:hypothetical protein